MKSDGWIAVFCVLTMIVFIHSIRPDQHEKFTSRYAGRTTYTVKTGEPLTGINCDGVVLAPREENDPSALFRLKKGDKTAQKLLDWRDYRPSGQTEGKTFSFGSFRLPRDFGDATIRILDLDVGKDNTATMTYCVDKPDPISTDPF